MKEINDKVDWLLANQFTWVKLSEEETAHLKMIANSVVNHSRNVINGGSFVEAICNNDLDKSVMRADTTMVKCIPLLVMIKNSFD